MPKRSYKPCSSPLCPNLTYEIYCKKHSKFRYGYDRYRGSASSRGYDARWRKARLHFLKRHPLCVMCEEKGVVEPAIVVDHIVPHRRDKELFWDAGSNWQALCVSCHSRKTVMEKTGCEEST